MMKSFLVSKMISLMLLTFGLLLSPLKSIEDVEFSKLPKLQQILVPNNLAEDQTVRLLCATVQGESVSFDWYLNDKKLEQDKRIKILNHEDSSELVIKFLSVDDQGQIMCKGFNKYGESTQKTQLIFNGNLF